MVNERYVGVDYEGTSPWAWFHLCYMIICSRSNVSDVGIVRTSALCCSGYVVQGTEALWMLGITW